MANLPYLTADHVAHEFESKLIDAILDASYHLRAHNEVAMANRVYDMYVKGDYREALTLIHNRFAEAK